MPLSFIFWLIFVLCFIFSFWSGGYYRPEVGYRPFGPYFAIFLLIFFLGWRVFGFVIQN